MDAQLPPALVDRLRVIGYKAEHVNSIGLGAAADGEIWIHATRTGAVIMTKDEDFADLVLRTQSGPQVVWVRFGNVTNSALWRKLHPRLSEIIDALSTGERLIEIR